MERERLTRLVEDPELAGRADVASLNDLSERFPWFAGAQVLRSVVEHRAGEVLSEEVLRTAAAHVPSRTVLFDRVNTEPLAPALKIVPKEMATPEPVPEIVAPPEVIAPTSVQLEEIKSPVPLEETAPVSLIDPSEQPIGIAVEKPVAPPDPLDVLIQQAAKLGGYDIGQLGEPTLDEQPEPEHVVREPPTVAETAPEPVVAEQPAPPAIEQALDVRSKRSFTDWLSAALAPIEVTPPKAVSAPPSSVSDWQRGQAEPTEDLPALPSTPRKRPQEPSETMDLIDRFIRQQEPPPLPKAEFYTPQQAGKRSLDDSTGMVTETLAKVYVKQGNLPKAIEAYHKLALKYPEKSAFFAALAKELEVQQHK